ncbi:hypothetical protein ALP36_101828, partial [Pseudomonas syringae pv. coriandricola]
MRPDAKVEKVYLYPNPMDFLKSIDGLAALVELDISTRKTLTSCPGSVDHYNPGPSNRRRRRPKASFSPPLAYPRNHPDIERASGNLSLIHI